MEIFDSVLILLALIGVSNILNRFLPFIPVPLFQIGLGILVSIVPPHIHLPLNPELFFVLFVAPLLFNDGKRIPRDELWNLRAPILLMALGLVLATVLIAGYYIHYRIDGIPLAAAFALAAILSPTDAVSVSALAGKIKLPKRILRLLEGESLMNDASGLVAFKFAVAAAVTGVFSLANATLSFFIIALGGLVCGALLSLIIIRLRVWIRGLGMEDVTFHMLVQILTPFLVYLVAEELGVSGILAVVAGGLVHAVEADRVQVPQYKLKITSESTWSVILFLLNGLVFVILGLQLPEVAQNVFQNPSLNNLKMIGYILEISLLLIVLRFIWVFAFWKIERNTGYNEDEPQVSRVTSSLLTALSGVRGTVTLAGAFSIPYLLADGSPFPQRDVIIFISAGVILVTLLTASLLLPLVTRNPEAAAEEEPDEAVEKDKEQLVRIKLLQTAIRVTKEEMTEENRLTALELISYYNQEIRSLQLERTRENWREHWAKELEVRTIAFAAERIEIDRMLEAGEITEELADKSKSYTDHMEYMLTHRLKVRLTIFKVVIRRLIAKLLHRSKPERKRNWEIHSIREIKIQTSQAAMRAIKEHQNDANREASNAVLNRYRELVFRLQEYRPRSARSQMDNDFKKELRMKAMQAERDEIQQMYEEGKISRKLASELRQYINLVEVSMLGEEEAE